LTLYRINGQNEKLTAYKGTFCGTAIVLLSIFGRQTQAMKGISETFSLRILETS
jgi:hypothetical protein